MAASLNTDILKFSCCCCFFKWIGKDSLLLRSELLSHWHLNLGLKAVNIRNKMERSALLLVPKWFWLKKLRQAEYQGVLHQV